MQYRFVWTVAIASVVFAGGLRASSLLPHFEKVGERVYAAGFAEKHRSANCGWVELEHETLLIDLPRGIKVSDFLAEVKSVSAPPPRTLVLTRFEAGDAEIVAAMIGRGLERVYATAKVQAALVAVSKPAAVEKIHAVNANTALGDASTAVELIPLDEVFDGGAAAVYLAGQRVLFAGPVVVNGRRVELAGSDTALWASALLRLEQLEVERAIPGFGSWGDVNVVIRVRRFLVELRRQVAYVIAQGIPQPGLQREVSIPADYLVWMPYDNPRTEDLEHVYKQLTVPFAPYGGRLPERASVQPNALVLIGDRPHEPGHIEEGLRPVFEATGVVPYFTVDVQALSAENLARVPLLVILRDGLQRPKTGKNSEYIWMTPEQERAVVEFVEGGGAFLNLHNSMGLYPPDGPYLNLVGGRYIGHGPLERFRVEVVDPDHAVSRGVSDFSVADEQHTPPYDADKVHLLLRNRSDDGKVAAAGWAYEPGKGRLCHLANGHTRESLLHPMYQRLMRNAVNWCLRRE